MTTLIEKLMVGLGIDTSEYQKGLGDADKETRGATKNIISMLSGVGGTVVMGALGMAAAGVTFLAGSAVMGVNSFRDWAGVLDSMGDVLGTNADESAALAFAIKSVGGNVEGITSQMTILTRGLVDAKGEMGPTGKVLDSMGISFKTATGEMRPATEILEDVANQLADMPDGLEKTALMTDLFGKSGKDLTDVMNALADGGLQRAGEEAKAFGLAIGDDASQGAVEFGIQVEKLKMRAQGFFVQIGGSLLPVLGRLATMLQEALANPTVQAGISALVSGITNFANQVITWIPMAIEWFVQLFNWFQANPGVIVGILAAVGVAVAAFVYTTVIPAAIAAIVALAPILLVMAAIAAVAYLVYEAWTNNWGGIRTTITEFWVNTGKPIFDEIVAWLKVFIPQAIEVLKNFWTNVLLPAIRAVWSWIQTSLIPMLQNVWNWLKTVIPPALEFLAGVWQNVLLPAITAVWDFITGSLVPLLQVLWELVGTSLKLAVTALAGLWENVLQPALKVVWEFIQNKIVPILKTLWEWFKDKISPVVETLANGGLDVLKKAFDGIKKAIQYVIEKVKEFIQKLKDIKLPDWLTPGSPTPFELGLVGIARAMDDLNRVRIPAMSVNLSEVGERNRRNEGSRPVVIYGGVTVGGRAGSGSVLEELMALGGSY